MGFLDDAKRAADGDPRRRPPANTDADRDGDADGGTGHDANPYAPASEGQVATMAREFTVTAGGEEVTVERPSTSQTSEEGGTWLSGTDEYGRPRGVDALENRQIVQTSAMQSIVNGVAGQILGGELVFEGRDDVLDDLSPAAEDAAAAFRSLLRDILEGPHLPNDSLDQLIVAAVEDMMGPGQAVWQLLGSESGDLPVVAMQSLDPLTIRMNVDQHNVFGDPPYWQAANAFGGGEAATLGNVEPTPLDWDQIAVLDYPYGSRSYQYYPISPAYQVREWLEILANSTTHHNRFYSDNEIPPGLIQVVNASDNTVQDIKDKIQQASGDPRDVPIVGGEGGAQWLDMGGTAVNLNVIEEQRWFFFMCLGALGLGKAEVGLIEDVNRSNGEVEATRVYKRVAGPFIDQFSAAFTHVAEQFDIYTELGKPFVPTIGLSDPREQRAKEQRLRKQYQAGTITLRQYARRTGNADIAESDDAFTVEIGDEAIDYGQHPRWVAQALINTAAGDTVAVEDEPSSEDDDEGTGEGGGEEQSVRSGSETDAEWRDADAPGDDLLDLPGGD